VSVMIPCMIVILDTSVANVSLTHIQGSLSAGQEEVTWVLTSFIAANAVVIPMSGWLARLFGRKRYLISSIILFTISSMLCGMATSLPALIFFRVVQGVGGGGLQPISQSILLETFPVEERGMAMGIFGLGIVLGPIIGPLLGGYITDSFSWRWIFYINFPIGILAVFMCMSFVFDPPYQQRLKKGEKVDRIGLMLLFLGIGSLQIMLDRGQQEDWFNSQFIVLLACVAFFCIVLLIFWELHHESPVLDLRIFKDRSFATGNLIVFLGFFAFYGAIVLLPLFLQTLLGYTSYQAGLVLGPGGALTLLMLPIVGKLTERFDSRILLGIGLLVIAYSVYYMAGFNLNIDFRTAVMGRLIQGIGMPLFFVTSSFITMAYIANRDMINASAIFNLLRSLGGSFGVAFVSTLLARRTQFHHHRIIEHLSPFEPGFNYRLEQLKAALDVKLGAMTDHGRMALAIIYRSMRGQAAAMSYNDIFIIQCVIFLSLLGALFILRKPPIGKRIK